MIYINMIIPVSRLLNINILELLLVMVRSGPASSHAHIRLPTLPSSADGAITFSCGHLFGLAVLDLGARSIVPRLHAHTHYIQPVLITSRTATKRHIQILHDYSILVRDTHGGGWSRNINARYLHTLMVYL
jgi:hypothetical protein